MRTAEIVAVVTAIFIGVAQAASGSYGWSSAPSYNQSTYTCLEKQNNAGDIVLTGMSSNGQTMSTYLCTGLGYAKTAGFSMLDVHFTPCPTCKASAADQLAILTDGLKKDCDSAWSHKIWLDFNTYQFWTQPWNEAGYKINQKFLQDLVDACLATSGVTCAVHSSPDQWKYITGSASWSYKPATTLPLMYYSLNDVASFDDFVAFGGFTTPSAKQYSKVWNTCGIESLFENWAPSW